MRQLKASSSGRKGKVTGLKTRTKGAVLVLVNHKTNTVTLVRIFSSVSQPPLPGSCYHSHL